MQEPRESRRPLLRRQWRSRRDSREFGIDPKKDNPAVVFAGDSPNDAPMFRFFENAVGVANVTEFRDTLEAEPAYVTTAPSGAGFAELASALLGVR